VKQCYKLGVSNTSLSIRYLNIHENLKISIWVGITIDDYGKIRFNYKLFGKPLAGVMYLRGLTNMFVINNLSLKLINFIYFRTSHSNNLFQSIVPVLIFLLLEVKCQQSCNVHMYMVNLKTIQHDHRNIGKMLRE